MSQAGTLDFSTAVARNDGMRTLDRLATVGRVVQTPNAALPYRVVLSHDNAPESRFAFRTMRECEAFIRRNTPRPPARSTLFDREPSSM
jgi:hypothetical protein